MNQEQYYDRESLLKANSKLIQVLQERIKGKRFRPQEGDTIKLGYIRALITALTAQNAILKDQELSDIKERLDKLESVKGEDNSYTEQNTHIRERVQV
jgi:hypothetical protein